GEIRSILSELKRRKVFRVMVVYAAVGFLVVQVAELLVPALLLPDWILRAVVLITFLGFPVALVLAWAFEMTPGGVRRSDRIEGSAATPYRRVFLAVATAIAAVLGAGAWYWLSEAAETDSATVHSTAGTADTPVIAVLPFDNLSDSEENEYFSDGITEDILTQLSKIRELRVISRQSVMRYKDAEQGMREIADSLGASHIVEGTVRRAANNVRITAQLIDARDDRHMWAERYDRELTAEAIFGIQSEIAGEIAHELQTTLSPELRGELATSPTEDLTAYDYYLEGREHAERGTREDIERGIAFLRQAIAEDPDYALAYAALAFAYTALVGGTGAPGHWLDSAEVAARKAIELDPGASESHSSLAVVYWNSGRIEEALDAYGRALELRPNDARSLWGMAFATWLRGELTVALRLAKRAVTLDPAHGNSYALLGRCYMSLKEFEEAERAFRRALQIQPDSPWAHEDLVLMFFAQGRYADAAEQLRILGALRPDSPEFLRNSGYLALLQGEYDTARQYHERFMEVHPESRWLPLEELGFVYARLGDESRAEELWGRATAHAEGQSSELDLARIAAARGERDDALRWLEAAYEKGWRGFPMIDIQLDPLLESLRRDPRFQELRNRILADVERMRLLTRRGGDGLR
ncbi:MAG: tetratricopeptide repeat protein, partial [Gemmatimonadota bacterium]